MRSRRWTAFLLALLWGPAPARAGEAEIYGFLAGRGVWADAPAAWTSGGWGRFTEEGDGETLVGRAQAQAGLDWRPSPFWTLHVHGLGRLDEHAGGSRAGIAEAFLQYRPDVSASTKLRFRLGTLFPGTSRENTGELWSSPYTLTLSALNAWVGEEVRPTGLEGAILWRNDRSSDELQLAAMVFGGNDASGALLAWRGWAMGDRLAVLGETVPLPPRRSLAPGGDFAAQKDSGTTPLDELDGRLGWILRARASRPGLGGLQAAFNDNRGDRLLHRGQYSWHTRFASGGADLAIGRFVLLAEGALGRTGMGPKGFGVDSAFRAGYVLASWGGPRARVSVRFDGFRNVDEDGNADREEDSGHAWTAAFLWLPAKWLRLGVEGVDLRTAVRVTPADDQTRQRRGLVEARFVF